MHPTTCFVVQTQGICCTHQFDCLLQNLGGGALHLAHPPYTYILVFIIIYQGQSTGFLRTREQETSSYE